MERFKYYGQIDKIAKGTGALYHDEINKFNINFEIAKRGEEKLLFNAICEDINHIDSFHLFQQSRKLKLTGTDEMNRNVKAIDLLIKDIETSPEGDKIINGYVGQCEIGEKSIKRGYEVYFNMLNFLFEGNLRNVEKVGDRTSVSWPALELKFKDFECRIQKCEDYSLIKQLLKRQGGVIETSILVTTVSSNDEYDSIKVNVRKLCQLLSVSRSTFINWGTCRIKDTEGNVIYELHGNAITRPFHGNNLINDMPEDTVQFLHSAWKAYEKFEEIFDLKRFLNGYADTFMNTFIETRSLNIAVLVDNISSRWAIHDGREKFLDEKLFIKKLPEIRMGIEELLEIVFDDLNKSYINVISSKATSFNRRPFDWKLKKLCKAFNCPINDKEIKRFVYIRDSLAHSALFPDEVESTQAFLFMRHFLDRIVLSVLDYQGEYFDMEYRKRKTINII